MRLLFAFLLLTLGASAETVVFPGHVRAHGLFIGNGSGLTNLDLNQHYTPSFVDAVTVFKEGSEDWHTTYGISNIIWSIPGFDYMIFSNGVFFGDASGLTNLNAANLVGAIPTGGLLGGTYSPSNLTVLGTLSGAGAAAYVRHGGNATNVNLRDSSANIVLSQTPTDVYLRAGALNGMAIHNDGTAAGRYVELFDAAGNTTAYSSNKTFVVGTGAATTTIISNNITLSGAGAKIDGGGVASLSGITSIGASGTATIGTIFTTNGVKAPSGSTLQLYANNSTLCMTMDVSFGNINYLDCLTATSKGIGFLNGGNNAKGPYLFYSDIGTFLLKTNLSAIGSVNAATVTATNGVVIPAVGNITWTNTVPLVYSSGTNCVINFALGSRYKLVLTNNCTLIASNFASIPPWGASIVVQQDGTGGRTVSYGTNWWFVGASPATVTTNAFVPSLISCQLMDSGGTNFVGAVVSPNFQKP